MDCPTNKFWRAYDRRDFNTLKGLTTGEYPEIPLICFEVAATNALLLHDMELLTSIDFPIRALMETVANRPEELRLLLEVIKDRLPTMDIPDYVWERTTKTTRKILKSYGKDRS